MNVIEVQNISKRYRLYKKPAHRLKELFVRKALHEHFDSLNDITFSIQRGESIGIIGENGAGKSTLLKILAKTLTPSSGRLCLNGRVAALLELGTGFHTEFSGRQNIYLNAALLGLEQSQIEKNEAGIIEFAELGAFIDQPIKTYSSGMIMRLAFSIATSVDPDILIIDEALSVGDSYFQKKCIDRMMSFRKQGKTILFCSHSTYSVNLLCTRAIWLDESRLRMDGRSEEVCAAYGNFLAQKTNDAAKENQTRQNKSKLPVMIRSILLNGQSGHISLKHLESLNIELEFHNTANSPFCIAMGIRRSGEKYWHAVNMTHDGHKPLNVKGTGRVRLTYPSLPLLQGQYSIVGFILDSSGLLVYHKKESSPFTIIPPPEWNNEMGLLALDHEWTIL
ncbi:MAG: ABC transporter ATP-binding protein [Deltaproteobacteria bacterium]|nr:ABC transporter ATP-binding protein [Deltaproteobacteria bacterium]